MSYVLLVADGVVLIDPEYVKGRKVFGHVLAAFRYGREDLDVLGLTFRKDLYLAAEQIYPAEAGTPKRAPTRLQVQNFLLKIILFLCWARPKKGYNVTLLGMWTTLLIYKCGFRTFM